MTKMPHTPTRPGLLSALPALFLSVLFTGQADDSRPGVEDLLARMEVRDSEVWRLQLDFTVTATPSRFPSGVLQRFEGRWCRDGSREASRWTEFQPEAGGMVEVTRTHAIWDGRRGEEYTDFSGSGTVRRSQARGGLSSPWLPQFLGLESPRGSWARLLRTGAVEVMKGGPETALLWDPIRPGKGAYERPAALWIDPESLLVRKMVTYRRVPPTSVDEGSGTHSGPYPPLELEGGRFEAATEAVLLEWREVQGWCIPVRGRIRDLRGPGPMTREVSVDESSIRLNGSYDRSLFRMRPPADATVVDEMGVDATPSCGLEALRLWIRLQGRPLPPRTVAVGGEGDEGEGSLAALARKARYLGQPMHPIRVPDRAPERIRGDFIARVDPRTLGGEYVVARHVGEGEVRVIAPRGHVRRISAGDFRCAWTGEALVLPGSHEVRRGYRWIFLGISLCMALAILFVSIRKNRESTPRP